MSGPKCGHYQVVSAEEQRRRRLFAAEDRYARAAAAVHAFHTAVSASAVAYGDLGVVVPPAGTLRSAEAEEWEQASESLTAALEIARQQFEAAVAAARLRALSADGARVSSVLVDQPRPSRQQGASQSASAKSQETLTRIIGRLPAEAAPEVAARCDLFARRYIDATSEPERAKLLGAIRLLVQAEQDCQARIQRNTEILEGLYRELDGLTGEAVTILRGALKALDRSSELPSGLRERVAATKALAEAERDREFVLAAAVKALTDLGYGVGEDFRTAVPAHGALLELPHSSRHGLQVRERNRQLMLNVVRFDADGERDPLADKDAEESFCRDFARLKGSLREDGIDLSMLRADAPGQTPVQVLRDRSALRHTRRQTSAPIQAERS